MIVLSELRNRTAMDNDSPIGMPIILLPEGIKFIGHYQPRVRQRCIERLGSCQVWCGKLGVQLDLFNSCRVAQCHCLVTWHCFCVG